MEFYPESGLARGAALLIKDAAECGDNSAETEPYGRLNFS
jgi:hypothetical protein